MPRRARLPRTGPPPPHAGWVAVSPSGPAGKGLTAKDAQAAAKLSRLKDSTQVIYYPLDQSPPLALPAVFDRARRALPETPEVWLVGGSVRDALLRRGVRDLDFIANGDGLALARLVADRLGGSFFPLDETRRVGRVVLLEDGERFYLDFAQMRAAELNDDLADRDFTVNAMAAAVHPLVEGRLIDPMGGQADLKAKMLRMCLPASFANDPVRLLRAVRLAAELEFRIERRTREAARQAAPLLANVAAERVRDELMRMLEGRRPAAALRALDALGLLALVVPETAALKGVSQPPPHIYDVWEHTLAVVDYLEALLSVLRKEYDVDAASEFALGLAAARLGRYRIRLSDHVEEELSVGRSARGLLFLSALLHDIAKPQTRSVESGSGRIQFLRHEEEGAAVARRRCAALRLSNDEVERVAVTVAHHLRPVRLSQQQTVTPRRALYRFYKSAGEAGVDVCLLTLADLLGTRGAHLEQDEWAARVETAAKLLEAYYAQPEQLVRPSPLISGDDVITLLGVAQGPRVGEVLEAVREAQVEGTVSTREEAIEFGRRFLNERAV